MVKKKLQSNTHNDNISKNFLKNIRKSLGLLIDNKKVSLTPIDVTTTGLLVQFHKQLLHIYKTVF